MQAPDFWTNDGIVSRLLAPLGWIYAIGALARRRCTTPYNAGRPVVCVGNFVAGGAGKTPVALAIADWYLAKGFSPHFLTRGYGGRLAGPLRVDLQTHAAADVGDEALLLARTAPTWVSRARPAGAETAIASGADIVIMDDGFQNPVLYKDLSIVVVDGGYGIGNGRVIPAGPLREFLKDGLSRTDVMVILGQNQAFKLIANIPIIDASLVPNATSLLPDSRPVVAFAGIGRPQKFFDTLSEIGFDITVAKTFPDHHPYSDREISALKSLALENGARLITTEKDLVRLNTANADGIEVVQITVEWGDSAAMDHILSTVILNG
jgi:tetraacyldisaccharide 4'-kinase